MMTKSAILGKLTPFQNFNKILVQDQSTNDIISGIISNHELYKEQYDKISESFLGDNVRETARNVFNFLKTNVPYYIEPISRQTLRSPSAILALMHGADCKSYAMFANGIFDSLNRKGLIRVPIAYRFASYRDDTKEPQHVFSVLYPGTSKEIWIDPVLDRFDQRKIPNYYKDKKINMALIAMSGTASPQASLEQMQAYRDKLVRMRDSELNSGAITPGSSKELEYKVAINKVTNCIQDASINGIGRDQSQPGFDWQNAFSSLIKSAPDIITASRRNPQQDMSDPYFYNTGTGLPSMRPDQTQRAGFSTNTMLLIGGAAVAAFLIFRKK